LKLDRSFFTLARKIQALSIISNMHVFQGKNGSILGPEDSPEITIEILFVPCSRYYPLKYWFSALEAISPLNTGLALLVIESTALVLQYRIELHN